MLLTQLGHPAVVEAVTRIHYKLQGVVAVCHFELEIHHGIGYTLQTKAMRAPAEHVCIW